MDARRLKTAPRLAAGPCGTAYHLLVLLALGLLLAGCAATLPPARAPARPALLAGGHGGAPTDLAGAARLARRFARTYAAGAYRHRPPRPGRESAAVRRALAEAALRVPAARRGLRPRLLGLRLALRGDGGLGVTAWIGDGRFPPFSVGFTLSRRRAAWLVTSFSAPD